MQVPGQNPIQQGGGPPGLDELRRAFDQQQEAPLTGGGAVGALQHLRTVLATREQRALEINRALQADAQRTGSFNPVALMQLDAERRTDVQFGRILNAFGRLEGSLGQQDSEMLVAIAKDANARGSFNFAALTKLYGSVANRAGLLTAEHVQAASTQAAQADAAMARAREAATAVARDASASGSFNPVALQGAQLELDAAERQQNEALRHLGIA